MSTFIDPKERTRIFESTSLHWAVICRSELQHVILEIGERFGLTEMFIIGSSAILAALPQPPEGILTYSRDVDVIPLSDDEERMADQISAVMGGSSDFDEEYGYHAQGVSFRTSSYAPRDWQCRAIDVCVDKYVAHCMEQHDLVLSKLGAGRETIFALTRSGVEP